MKKRIGSLLLILALCFTLLPTAVMAEESVDAWDGSVAESFAGGTGTEEDPYQIANGAQLAYLAQFVNSDSNNYCAGKCFVLTADIDLNGQQWEAIGKGGRNSADFSGTFDGQYHKIINLYHHYTGDDYTRNGLFGVVSGTVKNLLIIDADIVSNDDALNAGILADWIRNGTVENCYTSGKIENNNGCKLLGGLIGQCTGEAQVKGCGTDATVVSTFDGDDCDTVGGLIGQWENSTADSQITDCWFGGSVSCNNKDSAVGGILGANFDFRGQPGVTIRNCLVATKDITSIEPGNVTWIAAVATPHITSCIWPDTPPDGVTLDEEKYPDNKGNYLAVTKLVVDLDAGTAGADPTFDQSSCGTAVSNFTSEDVLAGLQTNFGAGIAWVAGIKHPTFAWDDANIPADYTAVNKAIADAEKFDKALYSNYAAVEVAIKAVDRTKSKAEQSAVVDMAKAIEDAIAALQYKGADYTKVDAAIAKANALNKDNYKDFSAVEAAVKAVVRDKNITEQDKVDAMAKAIEDAINALVRKSSGGGSSSPSYSVTTPSKTENGTVTVSPRSAEKGDTVTITAKPDSGYQLDDLTVTDKNGNELKLTDKGNGKYTFTMPASKVEIKATFVKEVETSPFSDVSTSAYYYEAVKWAQEKGITGGIGNGLFGPNQPCTRAQIVTFLWRAAGSPEPKSMSSFSDVSADSYYAKAVAWAVENGITTGTGDGKFSPDATCTRAQSVTFLFRAIGKLVDSKAEFSDVLTDSYYANAVAWAVENGVTNGIGDGLFGPDNSCTRAQIVTFLFRAYQGK